MAFVLFFFLRPYFEFKTGISLRAPGRFDRPRICGQPCLRLTCGLQRGWLTRAECPTRGTGPGLHGADGAALPALRPLPRRPEGKPKANHGAWSFQVE